MAIHSIDAEDDQFAYRYDTQLLICLLYTSDAADEL
mgnify:FL=1